MRDSSVLIAVPRPSFERLIEHVLHGHPGLRVVGGSSKRDSPTDKAARLSPDLIIASTRLHGREPGVLASLKRSSPASTLILLTDGPDDPIPDPGADAWLPEDAVVQRLLPVIREALDRVRVSPPRRS